MRINTSHHLLTWLVLIGYGLFIWYWVATYFGGHAMDGASAIQLIQVYVEFILASVFFGVVQLVVMSLALIEGNRKEDAKR